MKELEPRLHYSLSEVEKGDEDSQWEVISILNSRLNREHFANPYQSVEEVQQTIENPNMHILALKDNGRIIGTTTIADTTYPQHDHFILLFAINENLQGRGLGKEMIKQTLEWSYATKSGDNRERLSMHAATAMLVPGWERMYNLLRRADFEPKVIWRDQFTGQDGKLHDVVRLAHYRKE